MGLRPPSNQDDMLPWDGPCDRPRPFQLDFASIWYNDYDYARLRAQALAQDAMKVQMERSGAAAGEDRS